MLALGLGLPFAYYYVCCFYQAYCIVSCVAVTLQEVVKRFQIYRSTGSSAATVY